MQQTAQTQGWHVAKWGILGWLETGIKFVGIVAGWIAFIGALPATGFLFRSNPYLVAIILLGLMTLSTIALPFVRIRQREVVSVIYALLNLTGHVAMLVALLRIPAPTNQGGLGVLFGICFVVGELVKQRFLQTTGYTEGGAKTGMMVNFSRVIMGIYILFVVFLLV